MKAMARALETDVNNVAGRLFDLIKSLNVPTSLAEIGMQEKDLDQATKLATKNPYYNPRTIDESSIRNLLESAFKGARPVQEKDFKVEIIN